MSMDQGAGVERERAEQQHREDARERLNMARGLEAEAREVRRRQRHAAQEARTPPTPPTPAAPDDVTGEIEIPLEDSSAHGQGQSNHD